MSTTPTTLERPVNGSSDVPGQRAVPVPAMQVRTDALLCGGVRPLLGLFALWAGVVMVGIVMVSGPALSFG